MEVSDIPVTVLMTVYNGERYLQDAAESVLSQSFEEFEFIIIDDASTDHTPSILENLSRQDLRVRTFCNKENLGLTKSLNLGLKRAQGDYIARIDADDLCEANRIGKQYEAMVNNPELVVLGSAATIIDENGKPIPGHHREAFTPSQIKAMLFFSNPLTHSSVMFRADAIRAIGGYDESYQRAQDYELWLRCLASEIPIEMLNESLVKHRYHDRRVTIEQPSVMEDSRSAALQKAYREVLGIDFSYRLLYELQITRLQGKPPAETSQKQTLRSLRKAQAAFRRRFRDDQEAIRAFNDIVRRLAGSTLPYTIPDKHIYIEYAAGGSAKHYVAGRLFGFMKRRASRIRIKLGYLRRKFISGIGE